MNNKFMNCTRCELCGTASIIYSLPTIEYSILMRLLSAPLAIMGLGILSASIFKSHGIHLNAKILFIAMSISAIICSFGILIDALYKFFVSNVMPDDMQCDYQVFQPEYFIGIRNIQIFGLSSLALSSIQLSIERTVATIFYRSYATQHATPILGLVLLIIQFLLSLVPLFYINVPKQMYPYSPPEIQNYEQFHNFSLLATLFNILSFLIVICLQVVNRYKKKIIGMGQLQVVFSRYELHDNMSTTKLISAVIASICVIVFSTELIFLCFMPAYNPFTIVDRKVLKELIDFAPYSELQLTLIPIVFMILVLVLPMLSTKLRQSFLCVSHLSICFPHKLTSTRSTSESSDQYGTKIHWNSKNGCVSGKILKQKTVQENEAESGRAANKF